MEGKSLVSDLLSSDQTLLGHVTSDFPSQRTSFQLDISTTWIQMEHIPFTELLRYIG